MRDKESEEESKEESEKGTDIFYSQTNNSEKSNSNLGINKSVPFSLDSAEMVETHISRVYLTPEFAYKQKKPVNFGFVDYTTLEKRIFFAKKELTLNRRACSGIYLDLVELRQKKGRLFTGFKGGRLMDVFVRMRRIDSDRFLSNILKSGKLDKIGKYDNTGRFNTVPASVDIGGILKKAAKRIYLFHKNARTSKRISRFGGYGVYKANWDDNHETIKEYYGKKTPLLNKEGSPKVGAVADGEKKVSDSYLFLKKINKSDTFFEMYYSSFLSSPLFSEFISLRAGGGFVRDVHGDLRMEHIAVMDPRRVNGICLMDCVEFDERYRCQDIYLDIAFLLMDFEFNGYFYESILFFGYYKNCFNYLKSIAPFGKYEPSVIPFFKAYRAIVRCKISLLSPGGDAPAKALKYFSLAAFYLALAQKRVVILNCGLSGSGKSSLSRLLSEWFYARVISTDEIRQNLYGSADKSIKYSADANIKVYENLLNEGIEEFEKGGNVIFDAAFLKRSHREKIISSFNKKDCIFIFVYSKIYDEKEEIILKRLADRFGGADAGNAGGLTDYSEADPAVYFNQKKYFEEPSEKELASMTDAYAVLFAQADAALELKYRFNGLMETIIATDATGGL